MKSPRQLIEEYAEESGRVLRVAMQANADRIESIALRIHRSLLSGGKVLFFGNGGSAADAQHLAAELVNRYRIDRAPLAGLALTTDTSILTSVSNDYGYSFVFEKQVRALARQDDVLIGISTSGTSGNVLRALSAGRNIGTFNIGMCGDSTQAMLQNCDEVLAVDCDRTPIVQQAHIAMGHILCDLVERMVFEGDDQ